MSSLNSFKFAIFLKTLFYLFIQINISRYRCLSKSNYEQIINFVFKIASNIHIVFKIFKFFKNDLFKAFHANRMFFATSYFFLSFSILFCFSHICYFCYNIFNFNNNLYQHLRFNYLSFTSRRRQKNIWNIWEKIKIKKNSRIHLLYLYEHVLFRDFCNHRITYQKICYYSRRSRYRRRRHDCENAIFFVFCEHIVTNFFFVNIKSIYFDELN